MWLSFGGPRTQPEQSCELAPGRTGNVPPATTQQPLHFAAATSLLASGAQPYSAATCAVTPEVLPTPSSSGHWLLRQHLTWGMLSGEPRWSACSLTTRQAEQASRGALSAALDGQGLCQLTAPSLRHGSPNTGRMTRQWQLPTAQSNINLNMVNLAIITFIFYLGTKRYRNVIAWWTGN